MRIRAILSFLVALVIMPAGRSPSAPATPHAPKPPTSGEATTSVRSLQIGPENSLGFARKARGKMNLVAVRPKSVRPQSVEFAIDGTSVGRCPSAPFKIEFDTTTVRDGEHVIKAVGRDEAGKEVWAASLKVDIVNSKTPMSWRSPGPGTGVPRPPPLSGPPARPTSGSPSKLERPGGAPRAPGAGSASKRSKPTEPADHPLPRGVHLDQTYSNDYYGFSIKYPETWTFRDNTVTMKPKSEKDFWIIFGTYPIEKAKLVVNVRRVKLEAGTDADRFATYNSYVKDWESRTVLGSPAFASTSRVLGAKPALIHRLIIIKDGQAWMLNCTDYVGKSPEDGLGILEHMAATITSPTQQERSPTPQTAPSAAPR